MIVAAFLVVLTILAYFQGSFIRKHNVKIYIGAIVISILAYIMKDKSIAVPFIKGFLGLSFFYIVMITGALPKKNKLRLKFVGVRREYSILGFIFISPHALLRIVQWLDGLRFLDWYGLIVFVLMIPLFVTSFVIVRRKMTQKAWKTLQSIAYIIYILLFIHLILNYTLMINLVLYLVLFIGYFVLKAHYEVKKFLIKKNTSK
ncbi:MAG: hypothetical protein K8Q99_06910 [Acholeplasmataceae bacterium]|nr:hypothetical protein [Acholeplasmataceae bacterium]